VGEREGKREREGESEGERAMRERYGERARREISILILMVGYIMEGNMLYI
jgi:hypothetical protein